MAVDFSGTSQSYGLNQGIITGVPITMSCWVNPDVVTTQSHIMSINDYSAVQLFGLYFEDTTLKAGTYSGGWANAITVNTPSTGSWQHACGIWAANNDRAAILDGDWANRGTNTTSKTPTGIDHFDIGAQSYSSAGRNYYNGRVAEAGVWNVALTQAEVSSLAAGVSPLLIRPESLIFYVPLLRDSQELIQGAAFSATGSPTVASHARIIQPTAQIIPFPIVSAGGSAGLTGTVTASITEADIVTGGKTIILTLTGDTFVAAGTGPIGSTADTQALIDGIDSAQAEATGWDAVVKVGIDQADVVRTSDTVCTITLDAEATYDITAQETITATIPAAVLTGASPIVATPTFTVDTVAAGATIPVFMNHYRNQGIA